MSTSCTTPNQLAKRWHCDPQKIIRLIRRGTLRAMNLAEPGSKRPRYRITPEQLAEFEGASAASTPAEAPQPRRRRKSKPATQYV